MTPRATHGPAGYLWRPLPFDHRVGETAHLASLRFPVREQRPAPWTSLVMIRGTSWGRPIARPWLLTTTLRGAAGKAVQRKGLPLPVASRDTHSIAAARGAGCRVG